MEIEFALYLSLKDYLEDSTSSESRDLVPPL